MDHGLRDISPSTAFKQRFAVFSQVATSSAVIPFFPRRRSLRYPPFELLLMLLVALTRFFPLSLAPHRCLPNPVQLVVCCAAQSTRGSRQLSGPNGSFETARSRSQDTPQLRGHLTRDTSYPLQQLFFAPARPVHPDNPVRF